MDYFFQGAHCWEFAVSPDSVLKLVLGPDGSGYGASLFGERFHYLSAVGRVRSELLTGEIAHGGGLRHPSFDSLDYPLQAEAWLAEISPHDSMNSRAWSILVDLWQC